YVEIILSENDDLSNSTRTDDSLLELVKTSERLKIEAVLELELEIESMTDRFSLSRL
ncbi:13600_t:CDS:1, partial [Funneliformis geosporum]